MACRKGPLARDLQAGLIGELVQGRRALAGDRLRRQRRFARAAEGNATPINTAADKACRTDHGPWRPSAIASTGLADRRGEHQPGGAGKPVAGEHDGNTRVRRRDRLGGLTHEFSQVA